MQYRAGPSLFLNNKEFFILALLCSKVALIVIKTLNPTLNINIADIGNIPILPCKRDDEIVINELSHDDVKKSKQDWDSFETSWDFKKHPLI